MSDSDAYWYLPYGEPNFNFNATFRKLTSAEAFGLDSPSEHRDNLFRGNETQPTIDFWSRCHPRLARSRGGLGVFVNAWQSLLARDLCRSVAMLRRRGHILDGCDRFRGSPCDRGSGRRRDRVLRLQLSLALRIF